MEANNAIADQFSCSSCGKMMHPPIKICKIGHNFCKVCDFRSMNCPYCNYSKDEGRNILLENVYSFFVFPCNNKTDGCDFVGTGEELKKHQLSCLHVAVKCPINVLFCDWHGKMDDLYEHILNHHDNVVIDLDLSSPSVLMAGKLEPSATIRSVIKVHSKLLLFTWCVNSDCTVMTWQLLFLGINQSETFLYAVELYDPLESVQSDHNYTKYNCETNQNYVKFSDKNFFKNFLVSDHVYYRIAILKKENEETVYKHDGESY